MKVLAAGSNALIGLQSCSVVMKVFSNYSRCIASPKSETVHLQF